MSGTAYQLEIQKYLNGFKNLAMAQRHLQMHFAIDIKPDTLTFSDGSVEQVWVYNYNIIKSRGHSKIENEARGLILNEANEVVSLSFPRFFNIHERNAADIEWKFAKLERKLDGSLIVVYGYKGEVFIQTRKSACASGRMNNLREKTYCEAAVDVLKGMPDRMHPFEPFDGHENYLSRYTWAFEYVGADNRLITPYETSKLVLLAAFRKDLGAEVLPKYVDNFAKHWGFERPQTYGGFGSEEDAIEFVKTTSGPLEEGFVAVDGINRRVKIKNPAYLAVSRAVNAGDLLSPRHFANIVVKGDAEETASYFPEFANILLLMQDTLEKLILQVDDLWIFHKDIESRKEFAEAVKHHPLCGLLFMARSGKIENFDDAVVHIKPDYLIKETKERHETSYKYALEEALDSRGQRIRSGDSGTSTEGKRNDDEV